MRSLVLASLLLFGCSSDDPAGPAPGAASDQRTVDDACATRCAADKKCNSTVDESSCLNTCKNRTAAVATKVRVDYVLAVAECTKTAACDKLDDCDNTAKASIAPTGAAQSFCDDLIKKNTECRAIIQPDKARCLNDWKVYADATLDQMRACAAKACNEYVRCVWSTAGLTVQ